MGSMLLREAGWSARAIALLLALETLFLAVGSMISVVASPIDAVADGWSGLPILQVVRFTMGSLWFTSFFVVPLAVVGLAIARVVGSVTSNLRLATALLGLLVDGVIADQIHGEGFGLVVAAALMAILFAKTLPVPGEPDRKPAWLVGTLAGLALTATLFGGFILAWIWSAGQLHRGRVTEAAFATVAGTGATAVLFAADLFRDDVPCVNYAVTIVIVAVLAVALGTIAAGQRRRIESPAR